MRHALAVVLALLAAFSVPAPQARAGDIVRLATEGSYPPWNFIDAGGKLVGLEIDLGHDLCKRANVTCEFVTQEWSGIIPGLQEGKYDAIIAGMSITDERRKLVDFTTPYAYDRSTLAAIPGSPLAAVLPIGDVKVLPTELQPIPALAEALRGKTVGVQANTTQARVAKVLFPNSTVREYATLEAEVEGLLAGRVDVVMAARSALRPSEKDGLIIRIGPEFVGVPLGRGVGMAFHKDDGERLAAFSAAISAATKDGTIAELCDTWLGYDASLPR